MGGSQISLSTLASPLSPLSSFANAWGRGGGACLSRCPARPQVHSKPNAAASVPNLFLQTTDAQVAPTSSSHSLGLDASEPSSLFVPSPLASPHSRGPFLSCTCYGHATLSGSYLCLCSKTSNRGGCIYCLFI